MPPQPPVPGFQGLRAPAWTRERPTAMCATFLPQQKESHLKSLLLQISNRISNVPGKPLQF